MRTRRSYALAILVAVCFVAVPSIAFATCYLNCPLGDNSGSPACPMWRSPDLNGDGNVNLVDLATFASHWPPAAYNRCCDLDCDGIIALPDAALFAAHWGHFGPVGGICI